MRLTLATGDLPAASDRGRGFGIAGTVRAAFTLTGIVSSTDDDV